MPAKVYAKVERNRMDELEAHLFEVVHRRIETLTVSLEEVIREHLRDAYRRGLIDGYAQGAAETEAPETIGKEVEA